MPGVSDLVEILRHNPDDPDSGGIQALGPRAYGYWYGEGVGQTPAAYIYQTEGSREIEGVGYTTRRCVIRCTVVIDRAQYSGPTPMDAVFTNTELLYGELRNLADLIADFWVRYRPPDSTRRSTFEPDDTFAFFVVPPVHTEFVYDSDELPGYVLAHIDAALEFTNDPLE